MDFSDLRYVGTRTGRDQTTDFSKLRRAVQDQLNNNQIRSPRQPLIVFRTFQVTTRPSHITVHVLSMLTKIVQPQILVKSGLW